MLPNADPFSILNSLSHQQVDQFARRDEAAGPQLVRREVHGVPFLDVQRQRDLVDLLDVGHLEHAHDKSAEGAAFFASLPRVHTGIHLLDEQLDQSQNGARRRRIAGCIAAAVLLLGGTLTVVLR